MPTEEEGGFTFVDKRRASADEPEPAAPSATQPPLETPEAGVHLDEDASGPTGPLHKLTVRDRLLMCIDILNQGAWIALGLVEDPATREVSTDVAAARHAIDSVAALAELVKPELDPSTQRDVDALVSELKLAYVQVTTKQPA